jgi:hypothetical protein
LSRIVDYTPANEQGIVSRILLAVHKTADSKFPASAQRQFAKTAVAEQAAAVGGPQLSAEAASETPGPSASVQPARSAFNPSINPSLLRSKFNPIPSGQPASQSSRDDSRFDFLVSEKQKSRRLFFAMIVLATAAFMALALLLASRNFGF